MKLKLVINSNNDDYKLFKTTMTTVAQLRKTAILRFTSNRLVVISTPRTVSSGAVLTGDQGQLWCTIPKDVFLLYNIASIREENTIAMECQCDSLVSVLKRYDRCNHGDLTIKLQSMPEWNPAKVTNNQDHEDNADNNKSNGHQKNPICALGCTFSEYLDLQETSKIVSHSFKVGVRLLYNSQDAKIQEPMVNYTKLLMFQLPPVNGEYGSKFSNFIKRLDRYVTLNHLIIYGDRNAGNDGGGHLRLLVHELYWKLDVQWCGPLETIETNDASNGGEQQGQKHALPATLSRRNSALQRHGESMRIDDSEVDGDRFSFSHDSLDDTTNPTTADTAEDYKNKVFIKAKDWKVCSKLYESFEEVVLAISHDESCVLHCSLDRGTVDESPDQPRERGQIIYYMARSKPL
ncbi:Mec3p Ecym_3102 [Eremothecium cymbalariae DBVPG|uniref:Uncharacterized protein n=1 Tax=Eremothecium cymbalariae (strain CBS 270.75 / DBVPG 7215 / KCTC 17166 / NRRL Y-17582) TaxID=931890 RepID=G8JR41_ERECY|nr:Hypothetical protein Ecym_3102 [Eremothecium cymbalariae DBVPG\